MAERKAVSGVKYVPGTIYQSSVDSYAFRGQT